MTSCSASRLRCDTPARQRPSCTAGEGRVMPPCYSSCSPRSQRVMRVVCCLERMRTAPGAACCALPCAACLSARVDRFPSHQQRVPRRRYARDAVLEALAAVGAELARWPIAAQVRTAQHSLPCSAAGVLSRARSCVTGRPPGSTSTFVTRVAGSCCPPPAARPAEAQLGSGLHLLNHAAHGAQSG